MRIIIKPGSWGRPLFMSRAHFYLKSGTSICGKTRLNIWAPEVGHNLAESKVCHFCAYALGRKANV